MHGGRAADLTTFSTGPALAGMLPRNLEELMSGVDGMNEIESRVDAILDAKTISATEKLFLKVLKGRIEELRGTLSSSQEDPYREFIETMYSRVMRALQKPTREEVVVVREGAVDRGMRMVRGWIALLTGGNSDKQD